MKRSSKNVPLFIIVSLLFFVLLGVLVNDFSRQNIQSYDVLGLNQIQSVTYDNFWNNNETDKKNTQSDSEQNDILDMNASQETNSSEDSNLELQDDEIQLLPEDVETSEKSHEEIVDETESDVATSTTETENEVDNSTDVEGEQQVNELIVDSQQKKTNDVIESGKVYTRTLDKTPDKVDFFTTDNECDYRVYIKTNVNDSPISNSIAITVYDERGIDVDGSGWFYPIYGNTSTYRDEFYFDFNLEKSKKHTLKIQNNDYGVGGTYQISIIELERDAGTSKDTARKISVGEEVTATLNSSLDDWFVCNIDEAGKYNFVLHNIDIGASVRVDGYYEDSSLFYISSVENESTGSSYPFYVHREGDVFVRISPDSDMPSGTYIMSINKE